MFILTTFLSTLLLLFPLSTAAPNYCRPLHLDAIPAPAPVSNTPSAFHDFAFYNSTALETSQPANFVRFVTAGHETLRQDAAYMTFKTMKEYNVQACATECENIGCASFNIYFQRAPTLLPGPDCPNPNATVLIRCAFFDRPLSPAHASNEGQRRGPLDAAGEDFEVMFAGSNAYNRISSPNDWPPPPRTATGPRTVTETVTVVVQPTPSWEALESNVMA